MNKKEVFGLFSRYILLVILGSFNLFLFYLVFTPLTVYPSFFILRVIYDATLVSSTTIFLKGFYANIIPACIAGSAYYFLLIINLSTPMKLKTRILSIFFLVFVFLFLNVLRIIFFASLIFKGFQYFDVAHSATWYFGSTILIILIWFANVKIFNIEKIPIYSDIKSIIGDLIK